MGGILGDYLNNVSEQWLASCLWHILCYHPLNGNPAGLFLRHGHLVKRAAGLGISVREWMDVALGRFRKSG